MEEEGVISSIFATLVQAKAVTTATNMATMVNNTIVNMAEATTISTMDLEISTSTSSTKEKDTTMTVALYPTNSTTLVNEGEYNSTVRIIMLSVLLAFAVIGNTLAFHTLTTDGAGRLGRYHILWLL